MPFEVKCHDADAGGGRSATQNPRAGTSAGSQAGSSGESACTPDYTNLSDLGERAIAAVSRPRETAR
jgi:hypothetical protein